MSASSTAPSSVANPSPRHPAVARPVRLTGGTWDPAVRPLYFASTQTAAMRNGITWSCRAALVDAHEITPGRDDQTLERWLGSGRQLLIDSGVNNFYFDLLRRTGKSFAELDGLPAPELPGYERLVRRYIAAMRRWGDRAWGYLELDLGQLDEKRTMRARLEGEEGLRPIPVFHLGSDPWDYFHELAETYDRVAVSRLIRYVTVDWAGPKLLAALWRHAQWHPETWLHFLGMTVTSHLHVYPCVQSLDSSNWTSGVQWKGYYARCDSHFFGEMPRRFRHKQHVSPTDPAGTRRAEQMSIYGNHFQQLAWGDHLHSLAALLADGEDDE